MYSPRVVVVFFSTHIHAWGTLNVLRKHPSWGRMKPVRSTRDAKYHTYAAWKLAFWRNPRPPSWYEYVVRLESRGFEKILDLAAYTYRYCFFSNFFLQTCFSKLLWSLTMCWLVHGVLRMVRRNVSWQEGPSARASGVGPGGDYVWWRSDGAADVDAAAASGIIRLWFGLCFLLKRLPLCPNIFIQRRCFYSGTDWYLVFICQLVGLRRHPTINVILTTYF